MGWNIGETHCKCAFEGFCVHSSVLVLEQSGNRGRSKLGMQNALYLGASADALSAQLCIKYVEHGELRNQTKTGERKD